MDLPESSPWRTLERLRERRPLVHVITSFVAADLTANLLLAAGARVVMAQDKAEAEDFEPASAEVEIVEGGDAEAIVTLRR